MIKTKDQELFDKISLNYSAKDLYEVSKKARKFQIDCLLELLEKYLSKNTGNHILEIGCGHGASSNYIDIKHDSYTGIDYSKELIKIANQKYKELNRDFICTDIIDYQPLHKFELIFGIGILHHLDDINIVLQKIKTFGHIDTIYGFIEPYQGNPIVQFLRNIRKIVDNEYSSQQHFFSKKELINLFTINDFEITKIKFQGYFTPPFAQIVLKPKWVMLPIVKLAIFVDKFIQNRINNPLSWNIILIAKLKRN